MVAAVFLSVLAACGSTDDDAVEIEGVDIVSGIEVGRGAPAMALAVRSVARPAYFPPVEVQSGAAYVTVIYDASFSDWPEIAPDTRFGNRNERLRYYWARSKSLCGVRAFLEDSACGTFVADYDLATGELLELVKADVATATMQVLAGAELAAWAAKEDLEELIAACTGDLDARAAANDNWLQGGTPDSCFKVLSVLNGDP